MNDKKWPNGAKLVISFSMQFETGGEPISADGPLKMDLKEGVPNISNATWYKYGAKEGVYRLLDLWDKHDIKVTSHVVGTAAQKYPEVAKAIADKGHEIAAHGYSWTNQVDMSYEEEKNFIKKGLDVVENITGKRGQGFNSYWMARSKNTLKILQDLDFLYHIDDISRDEPFIRMVRNKKFVIIPYTIRNNDLVSIENKHWTPSQFLDQIKADFDELYSESNKKRRMMSISAHDRVSGQPAMVNILNNFIEYAKNHEGVVFMRKDDIATLVKNDPNTPIDNDEDKYNRKSFV